MKKAINIASDVDATGDAKYYSDGVQAGGWVFTSGQTALDIAEDRRRELVSRPDWPHSTYQRNRDSELAVNCLSQILSQAGLSGATDIARVYTWLATTRPTLQEFEAGSSTTGIEIDYHSRNLRNLFREPKPGSTATAARGFLSPSRRVTVDAIAIPQSEGQERIAVASDSVAKPVGNYSPALKCGNWVFAAGAMATDFKGDFGSEENLGIPSSLAKAARTNDYFWYGASIERQVDYVMAELEQTLEAAGAKLSDCVKAELYIGHPQDMLGIETAWKRWFPDNPPARVVIPYMGLAAQGCRIEIALTALIGASGGGKHTIETSDAPEPVGHQPQAVRAGNFVFFSTGLAIDSQGDVPERLLPLGDRMYYPNSSASQLKNILESVDAISRAASTSVENLVHCHLFMNSLESFAACVPEWRSMTGPVPPAMTVAKLDGPLIAPGASVLLDLVGYAPSASPK